MFWCHQLIRLSYQCDIKYAYSYNCPGTFCCQTTFLQCSSSHWSDSPWLMWSNEPQVHFQKMFYRSDECSVDGRNLLVRRNGTTTNLWGPPRDPCLFHGTVPFHCTHSMPHTSSVRFLDVSSMEKIPHSSLTQVLWSCDQRDSATNQDRSFPL